MIRNDRESTSTTSKNGLKAKRIVCQMSKELQKTDVNDDFQNALESIDMDQSELTAGFNGFIRLQNQIKEALKNHMAYGSQEGLLSLLTARQMRSVTQMLDDRKSDQSTSEETKDDRYFPETVTAKRIQVVEVENPEPPGRSQLPIIPRLDVDNLDFDDVESEQLDWVSSNPGRSSSRIPDLPMEPEPKKLQEPKSKSKPHSESTPKIAKRIPSKPRPIQKADVEIQTDSVEKEEEVESVSAKPSSRKEKSEVQTVDIGLTCRLLTTPRVEEHVDPSERSQILSPISTITDISEGEVFATGSHVTVVRSDGSIVRPGIVEDNPYFGDSEVDLLRATSSSPLRVAEVDMSVSTTPTTSQC